MHPESSASLPPRTLEDHNRKIDQMCKGLSGFEEILEYISNLSIINEWRRSVMTSRKLVRDFLLSKQLSPSTFKLDRLQIRDYDWVQQMGYWVLVNIVFSVGSPRK